MKKTINYKIIALIIEVVILIGFASLSYVLEKINKPINIWVVVVICGTLMFLISLTLSIIRYDSMREVRKDDAYKGNLPLYTDKTTLICHDLKDEREKESHDDM